MAKTLNNITSSSSLQSKMIGLEGEKRFGTCKWKIGIPPGSTRDSHWSNWNNFFVLDRHALMFHDFSQHVMLPSFSQSDSIANMGSNINQCANVTSIPPSQTIFGNNGIGPSILHVAKTNCIKIRWHIERTRPISKV